MATKKASTEYVRGDEGVVYAVRFEFADGEEATLHLNDITNEAVRSECLAYAVLEATRDTYAAEKDPAKARALLLKRWATMVGPNGQYSSRGGARIDWVGLIMVAVSRLMPNLSAEQLADLRAKREAETPEELKAWLADPKRRALKAEIEVLRAEQKKAKATAGFDLD